MKFCKVIDSSNERAAGITKLFWEPNTELTISFLNGNSSQHQFVMSTVKSISEVCSITFKEVSKNGQIRISFNENDGAWSYIGQEILSIPFNEATMNLGWLDVGVVLHEFGHTLGLIHEHQSPLGKTIIWNRQQVIKDLSGPPNNWDLDTIEQNIFEKYDPATLTGTEVDSTSIMMYYIPASWTLNNFSSGDNQTLSQKDKELLSQIYPKDVPEPKVEDKDILIKYLKKEDLSKLSEESIVRIGLLFELPVNMKFTKVKNLKLLTDYLYEGKN